MPKVCYAITLRGFLVNLDYSRNIKVICLYKPRKEEFVQINPSLKYFETIHQARSSLLLYEAFIGL